MALVRCSCLTQLETTSEGRVSLRVDVLDPGCDYVVHRMAAVLLESPGAGR